MKRLLVQNPDGGLVPAAAWRSLGNEDFLLLPRGEYEVLRVEAPPVRGERLDAALPYRIRSLYPGATESTVLDHRPVPGDAGHRLVFAADRARLAALRAVIPGAASPKAREPIFAAGALLLASAPMEGPWVGVVWTSTGAEIVRLDGGAVLGSSLVQRDVDGNATVHTLARALERALSEAPSDAPVIVACAQDAQSERENLAAALKAALPSRDGTLRCLPLEEFARRPTIESCAVFREGEPSRVLGARGLARVFAVLAVILIASIPARLARIREAELMELKSEYEAAKVRSSAIMERVAEYDRLTARGQELEASRQPDAYRLLADIASGAGSGVRARSLTLEGASFRLEAEGSDGLTVLKRMQDSGLFDSVELRQSVITRQGWERYTLSGSVRK